MWPVFPIKATAVGIKIYVKETPTRTFCAEILGQIKAAAGSPPTDLSLRLFTGHQCQGP